MPLLLNPLRGGEGADEQSIRNDLQWPCAGRGAAVSKAAGVFFLDEKFCVFWYSYYYLSCAFSSFGFCVSISSRPGTGYPINKYYIT